MIMQTLIVILIVAAAAGYLIWRFVKKGPGGSCGCDCGDTCSPAKGDCGTENKK